VLLTFIIYIDSLTRSSIALVLRRLQLRILTLFLCTQEAYLDLLFESAPT